MCTAEMALFYRVFCQAVAEQSGASALENMDILPEMPVFIAAVQMCALVMVREVGGWWGV
jgi:hypothetical protein